MLRLDLPTEAHWIDCPYGVRLLCKPLTSALSHAAGSRGARRVAEMAKFLPDDQRFTDPDLRTGMITAEVTLAVAELVVEAWEGVGTADGSAAAPLTPEGLRALLSLPDIARAFNVGLDAPLARLVAEGNA